MLLVTAVLLLILTFVFFHFETSGFTAFPMLLLHNDVYLLSRQDTVVSNLTTPSHRLLLFVDLKSTDSLLPAGSSEVHVCGQEEISQKQCLVWNCLSESKEEELNHHPSPSLDPVSGCLPGTLDPVSY